MRPSRRLAGRALCLWALTALSPPSAAVAAAIRVSEPVEVGAELSPGIVAQVADWVIASGDNHGLPFVILDKVEAEISVFRADGHRSGAAPALIGLARGDDSAPGIGDRKLSEIAPEDRTTPAGRFIAAFGPGEGKAPVLWVDYATAISLHPVITSNPKERRVHRLRTPDPQDNRITYGCINVSVAFYEKVVRPAFIGTKGIVYILPETRPLEADFPGFRRSADAAPGA